MFQFLTQKKWVLTKDGGDDEEKKRGKEKESRKVACVQAKRYQTGLSQASIV